MSSPSPEAAAAAPKIEPAAEPMILTRDLRVDYGETTAVADLNLQIGAGEVFGLIGPNGAGKTSTIRVLATLLEPTYGEVRIAGIDLLEQPHQVHRVLGYMPDLAPVYDDLKVWEFLDLFAASHGLASPGRRRRVDDCLERVSLTDKKQALCSELSRGMTQRLVLAKTLLHDPAVLLLDEPASGLDPIARMRMRQTLRQLAADGRTVLISSHILAELSDMCSCIGIMERGRMVITGSVEEVAQELSVGMVLIIEPLGEAPGLAETLAADPLVRDVRPSKDRVEFDFTGDEADAARLLRQLIESGTAIKAFYPRRPDIEQILLAVGAERVS